MLLVGSEGYTSRGAMEQRPYSHVREPCCLCYTNRSRGGATASFQCYAGGRTALDFQRLYFRFQCYGRTIRLLLLASSCIQDHFGMELLLASFSLHSTHQRCMDGTTVYQSTLTSRWMQPSRRPLNTLCLACAQTQNNYWITLQ